MAKQFFAALTRNWISLLGTALAAASMTLFVCLFVIELVGFRHFGAYLGILSYLILPMFFVIGLLLIPYGINRERKLAKRAGVHHKARFPTIDLNNSKTRKAVVIFLALTLINIVVLATATYKGVEVMETTAFCGTVCHTVMQPEYTAHQRSPHSRIRCAECHIGPGADWFVKSKLDGSWQVIAVAFDLYPRPIETPLHALRPARETCEQCHWPTKFVGDKLVVKTLYDDDETNTELKTALLMRVGGLNGIRSSGIHWHVDPDVRIRFLSSLDRETMYQVELTRRDGSVVTYSTDKEPESETEWRTMDCIDCHNRPSHRYGEPGAEVDEAIAGGRIQASLPYIRREGVRVLKADYASHEEARMRITEDITAFYRENYPDLASARGAEVEAAADELSNIYSWNVFPAMNVDWGTYPDHIGHQNSPGCFRCHNRDLKNEDGGGISRNCSLCHSILARKEQNPEILQELNP